MKQLSIIIPMFNVAPYVDKCIRSLEDQDISKEEYEIICVNDGSPDNCKEIVEKLQKEFSNIILINQHNQGVSVARNNAIKKADGKYILSIDPDDYVVSNSFKRILEKIEGKQLDVLYLSFEILDFDRNAIWKTNYVEQSKNIYTGVEGYFASRGATVKDPDRSVAILYRREILLKYKIFYPPDVPFLEDGLFLAKVCSVAKSIGFDDSDFYLRISRHGSATHSKLFHSELAVKGFINAIYDLRGFETTNSLGNEELGLINHVNVKFATLPLFSALTSKSIFNLVKAIKILKTHKIGRLKKEGVRNSYKDIANYYNKGIICFLYFYLRYFRKRINNQ